MRGRAFVRGLARIAVATLALPLIASAAPGALARAARPVATLGPGSHEPTAPPRPRAEEGQTVGRALGQLAAERAEDRQAAQDFLADALRPTHLAEVAAAVSRGGPELRRRLALAIGSDDRHLGLALLLFADREADVRAIGREALHELLVRWSPSVVDPPLDLLTLPDEWLERETRRLRLAPDDEDYRARLDRFARLAGGPAPVIVTPTMWTDDEGARGDAGRPALVGDWLELLDGLMRDHRLAFQVLGYREGEPSATWLRVTKRGDLSEMNAERQLLRWLRGLRPEQEPARNRACARALAATGWPAMLRWFEERWLDAREEPALEGLFEAAVRGRVVPTLSDADRFAEILAYVDAQPSTSFVERAARALAEVRPTSLDGRALGPLLVDGWDALPERARWMRLVILEGQGPRSADVRARVLAEVEAGRGSTLRFQALRTLARGEAGGTPPRLVDVAAWIADARARGRLDEWRRLLVRLVPRVATLEWLDAVSIDEPLARALASWGIAAGLDEVADAGLARLLPRVARLEAEPWLEELRRLVPFGHAAALRARIAAWAARAPDGERLARIALARLDLLGDLAARDAVEALVPSGTELVAADAPALAWAELAVLAPTSGTGWRARNALTGAIDVELDQVVLRDACELALGELRRARLDEEAESLADRLRSRASRSGHPLAALFWEESWPPRREPAPQDLDERDRCFE